MNTREAMERLAKCGVVVHGHRVNASTLSIWYDDSTQSFVMLDRHNDHAEVDNWVVDAILEAAWHRKWPHLTVEDDGIGNIIVRDWTLANPNNGIVMDESRVEAMVLYAEHAAKESP